MWVYYALILMSVFMFGGGFAIQDQYRKKRGSGLMVSMESTCIGSVAGAAILLLFFGFSFEASPFTIFMAVLAALNGMAFTFCAFKALDYINLSLFSLFSMLGGMALPFFVGIVFYNEGFTVAKSVCVVFICISLLCTVERGKKKRGTAFYVGIFILNGMAGVISKLFTATDVPKSGAMEYSVWVAVITAILSGVVWMILALRERRGKTKSASQSTKSIIQAYSLGAINGVINRVANFLLVFALLYVDTSVQYPFVTGGTMIVSSVISFFGEKKPRPCDLLGVAFAFIGMCALFFIPI